MSIQFSDTTNFKGLIQLIEQECGFNQGDISGNTALLKHFTAGINLTLDDYIELAIKSSGTWQLDDTSEFETDGATTREYPIIKTNLVSGQRDYTFTTDEGGNLVLDIYKVAILPSATGNLYQEIEPMDELSDRDNDIITEGTNTGVPSRYGKLANGIFLDLPTSYNATNGLKVYVNREASYFSTSDTTKKPGVPGIHHEYFVLKPSLRYARRKGLANLNELERAVIDYEGSERLGVTGKIQQYFTRREKDVVVRAIPETGIYE